MKLIVIATLLALAAGCKQQNVGISDIQSTLGERHIHVRAEGGAWVGTAEDTFTVTLPGHKVVIEKERVLLDGEERAKFPATALRFKLVRTNDYLHVTADGASVLTTTLGK